MTLLHVLHAVAVGGLLSAAAVVADAGLRGRGGPARGVWVAVLLATVTAPFWGPRVAGDAGPDALMDAAPVLAATGAVSGPSAPSWKARVRAAASRPVAGLEWGWWVMAGLGAAVVVGGLLRMERRVARWPRATVDGEEVSVTGAFGPALVGLRRPRTVVPGWVLRLAPRDVSLILAHERSHRTAGDGLLLAAALLTAALCPWNPFVWLQFRRLRDAVEMDCDRRLLRAGVPVPSYARVLVLVRLRSASVGGAAAALVESSSSLERRLKTMRGFSWTRRRVALSGTVALGLVALACETPAPSAVDVETVTAEAPAAEETPTSTLRLRAVDGDEGRPLIVVDGVIVPGVGLPDLQTENIDRIEVVKGAAAREIYGERAANGVVQIFTNGGAIELPLDDSAFEGRHPLEEIVVEGRDLSFGPIHEQESPAGTFELREIAPTSSGGTIHRLGRKPAGGG